MKKRIPAIIAATMAAAVTVSGCANRGTTSGNNQSTGDSVTEAVQADGSAGNLESNYLITNVYGDGQKPWIIVLEYGSEIDSESVSVDDFTVDSYDIAAVYTNTQASIPTESVAGNYVLIELSTDYTNAGYTTETSESGDMGPDSTESRGEAPAELDADSTETMSGGPGGMGPDSTEAMSSTEGSGFSGGNFQIASNPSNELSVTWTQTGEISGTDGSAYAPSDESYTTDYNDNTNLLVDDFEQLTYTCEDGVSMMYNLYLPENYDENTSYPLVLFMPDATGEGSDAYLTLTESLGAVIWTTEESQSENPCIVLAPQYENSNSSDPAYTMELLQSVMEQYAVDDNRLYLAGQSSGTIRSIKLLIDYPDTFAGAMLVAGQAETEYEDLLSQLSDDNIWLICSAGDERAYPGMTAIVEAVEAEGTTVTTAQWSADLSADEQNALAAEMQSAGTSINFTIFDAGTVMEDDVPVSAVTEHMNTWRVAYNLTTVRNWLLAQTNE